MNWLETINEQLSLSTPIEINDALKQRIVGLMDLTSLSDTDTDASIATFLEKATTPYGHVAAVCLFPRFVSIAATQFAHSPIKVATVVNFPEGLSPVDEVMIEISRALEDGAQEIDVVFPYQCYLAGEREYAQQFVAACKAACGDRVTLKVILETGVLAEPTIIADASFDALMSGADFIKTSTGKVAVGATLEAAAIMLLTIKRVSADLKRSFGFKASGGIRTIEQAAAYVALADRILGKVSVTAGTFRLGTSRLLC